MAGAVTAEGLPAPFLEPFAERITTLLGEQLPAEGTPMDVSGITPTVAAVNPFIQQAQQRMATQAGLGQLTFGPTGEVTGIGQGTGIAAYQPYLQTAESLAAPSAYQQFMSPYQQEVISETQRQLDEARAAGRSQLSADAIKAGAFGGGREGIARAEYERQRDVTDAGILANLRQQGLQRAQTLQQQAIANQLGFGEAQEKFESGITSGLGQQGTGAQAYSQSVLDAIQQGNVLAETFPTQKLQQISSVFTPLLTGAPYYSQPTPPLMTSPGLTAAQAFGSVFGPVLGGQKQGLAGGFMPQGQQQQQQFGIGSLYG
jgi:hypothetical protein